MPTIHQVAEGAEQLAATTTRVAEASQHVAVVAAAADDVVRTSRNLMRWFIVTLVVLAVVGAVLGARRQRDRGGEATP